ncbi:MAG: hypothetical protein KDA33_12870 [Phycisphaerales bacterium]|nr:hypothetical protein [Phycisphaerales bacterium]
MSLKAFHVFFVAISILMCVSLGVWGVRGGADSTLPLSMAVVGFGGAVTLSVYGVWMLRKLKRFSYV